MKSLRLATIYGLVIWATRFFIGFFLIGVGQTSQLLFGGITLLGIFIISVICAIQYFRKFNGNFVIEGMWLGGIWLLVNLILDLPTFAFGPTPMLFNDFLTTERWIYLILPTAPLGVGWFLQTRLKS